MILGTPPKVSPHRTDRLSHCPPDSVDFCLPRSLDLCPLLIPHWDDQSSQVGLCRSKILFLELENHPPGTQFQPGGLGRDQNKIEGSFVTRECHIPTWAVREDTDRELRAEANLGRGNLVWVDRAFCGPSSAWPHSS